MKKKKKSKLLGLLWIPKWTIGKAESLNHFPAIIINNNNSNFNSPGSSLNESVILRVIGCI